MAFKPRILVVEDDGALLRLFGNLLEETGAIPVLLDTSVEAVERISKEKFDGAILDWMLPDVDGLELARTIRMSQSNYRIPIVMVTGREDHKATEESFKAGINFFLRKPVAVNALRSLLNATRGSMLAERRRYQRAPVSFPALLRWGEKQEKGLALNLSSTGIFVAVEDPPPENSEIRIEFSIKRRPQPVRLSAHVIRITPGAPPGHASGRGVGLEFLDMTRSEQQALMEFVEKTLEALEPDR